MKFVNFFCLVSALIFQMNIIGCNKKSEEKTKIYESNLATLQLPDAELFKVYRKIYGTPPIKKGQIIVYLNSWYTGERRFVFDGEDVVVTNPLSQTLYQNRLIKNPDSSRTTWKAREASEFDSLPPVKFKSYTVKEMGPLYERLIKMGVDTMVSPRFEEWDLHENRFYIIESFVNGKLNIFQFSLVDVDKDPRYMWIDTTFMAIDPGKDERAGILKNEWLEFKK